MNGTLYIVATPIGNSEDITIRAKRVLAEADLVAAEDTRTAHMLFSILGIRNETVSNHNFNEKRQVDFLLSELESGKNVAIVSDAGTPCVSDPGAVIVKAAVERGINITGVCGASAVITALSICGFYFNSFSFYGFLPRNANDIKKAIEVAQLKHTAVSVFYESPKRIKKSFEVFADETPDAEFCLCNDLTKRYERVYRGAPRKILDELNSNPSAEKGEYTLVANFAKVKETVIKSELSLEAMLIDHITKNNSTAKEAVNALAKKYKGRYAKKEFYEASLNLRLMLTSSFLTDTMGVAEVDHA